MTTTVAKLKQKYESFAAPLARIEVEGKEIVSASRGGLLRLSVELTSGFEASGCRFTVVGEYVPEQTAFSASGPAKSLQLGAKVTVELGYIVTETVFKGLITRVDYLLEAGSEAVIEVECMDAKCLLMKTRRLEIRSEKKMSKVVEAMLSRQPVSQYLDGRQIDAFGADEDVIATALESDYQFLVDQARYYGLELFLLQGKLVMRKRPASGSPVMKIDSTLPVYSARLSLSGDKLLKKFTVKGINAARAAEVSGAAAITGTFSRGSTAQRMIGSTECVEFDPLVSSAGEAAARARVLAGEAAGSFGTMELRCVGIPELAPGRFLALADLFPEANRTYYIRKLRHTLDSGGFHTTLEAGVNSL